MPKRTPEELTLRKERLFSSLEREYGALNDLQDAHNATPYKCHQTGACCQVGLQIPVMECENIALHLQERFADDPRRLKRVVAKLKDAFQDKGYDWEDSTGDLYCAFYKDGCTIYPFRPAICRMYGVTIEVDVFCPRKRLPGGEPYVFVQKETDRQMARYYRIVDDFGRLVPGKDWTVFMPAGVLSYLIPKDELAELKARTDKKFWRRWRGYRTQYKPSYRRTEKRRTNVVFPFAEKWLKREA